MPFLGLYHTDYTNDRFSKILQELFKVTFLEFRSIKIFITKSIGNNINTRKVGKLKNIQIFILKMTCTLNLLK